MFQAIQSKIKYKKLSEIIKKRYVYMYFIYCYYNFVIFEIV